MRLHQNQKTLFWFWCSLIFSKKMQNIFIHQPNNQYKKHNDNKTDGSFHIKLPQLHGFSFLAFLSGTFLYFTTPSFLKWAFGKALMPMPFASPSLIVLPLNSGPPS